MKVIWKLLNIGLCVSVLAGCGKKARETSDETSNPQMTAQQRSEIEALLEKQVVSCESGRVCPSYLVKVVTINGDRLQHCTGFLTDSETVVTSASCLPSYVRFKGESCKNEVHFFLEDGGRALRLGCSEVLEVSQLPGSDPSLWRSDLVYLKLGQAAQRRRTLTIEREGMPDGTAFSVWSIDQVNETQSLIRKSDNCKTVMRTYFNPLAVNDSSPLITLVGCAFQRGNSGAPVISDRGRVRGVVSSPLDRKVIQNVMSLNILERPLLDIMHVTNYACGPSIYDNNVRNENECNKDIDGLMLQRSRDQLLNPNTLFQQSLERLQSSLNDSNKYLRIGVRLVVQGATSTVETRPVCFKNVAKWMIDFRNIRGTYAPSFTYGQEIPQLVLKVVMDEAGRIKAGESVNEKTYVSYRFSPNELNRNKMSDLLVTVNGVSKTIPKISESCSSLF